MTLQSTGVISPPQITFLTSAYLALATQSIHIFLKLVCTLLRNHKTEHAHSHAITKQNMHTLTQSQNRTCTSRQIDQVVPVS